MYRSFFIGVVLSCVGLLPATMSLIADQGVAGGTPTTGTSVEKAREAMRSRDVPVLFVGKVVDMDDRPVENAKVSALLRRYESSSPTLTAHQPLSTTTDASGIFRFENVSGSILNIRSIAKSGYEFTIERNPRRRFKYAAAPGPSIFAPDESQPVAFRLRKKGPGTFLVRFGGGPSRLHFGLSSKTMALDFLASHIWHYDPAIPPERQIEKHRLDLRIVSTYSEEDKEYTVKLSVSAEADGLYATNDLLYEAPAEGYQKDHELKLRIGQDEDQRIYLYVRSRIPAIYSRVVLDFWPRSNGMTVYYSGVTNPYGNRNLEMESDLLTIRRLPIRLEEEVKRVFREGGRPKKPDFQKLIAEEREKMKPSLPSTAPSTD